MVLTKEELVTSLQNEVRIFLHLASKIDPAKVDYRPSAKQRSTIELLRYMCNMAPNLLPAIKTGAFDGAAFQAAAKAVESADLDTAIATIGKQSESCAAILAGYTDDDMRGEIEMFGRKATRGWFIVNLVLCAYAAYRMQLFLYLRACGRDELNTMNLWGGVDGSM